MLPYVLQFSLPSSNPSLDSKYTPACSRKSAIEKDKKKKKDMTS